MGMLLVIRDRERRFLGNMCPSVVIVGRSVVMPVTCRLVRCHFKWAYRNTRQSRLQPGSYNDLVGASWVCRRCKGLLHMGRSWGISSRSILAREKIHCGRKVLISCLWPCSEMHPQNGRRVIRNCTYPSWRFCRRTLQNLMTR